MRTPRDHETYIQSEPIHTMVVRSTTDPAVYALVVPYASGIYALTVHVTDDDGHRIADASMYGREDPTRHSLGAVVETARRAVAEQADYRAEKRGTLVREVIPDEVAKAAGLHSWIGIGDDEKRRVRQVAQDWADERVEETGARFADIRQGADYVMRAQFHYDLPRPDPGPTAADWAALDNGSGEVARAFSWPTAPNVTCHACGNEVRAVTNMTLPIHLGSAGENCPAAGEPVRTETAR
jgi:hypothetical protein